MKTADEQSAGALLWQGVRARYEDPLQNLQSLADDLRKLESHFNKIDGIY